MMIYGDEVHLRDAVTNSFFKNPNVTSVALVGKILIGVKDEKTLKELPQRFMGLEVVGHISNPKAGGPQ